jgi:hypothetical protein
MNLHHPQLAMKPPKDSCHIKYSSSLPHTDIGHDTTLGVGECSMPAQARRSTFKHKSLGNNLESFANFLLSD